MRQGLTLIFLIYNFISFSQTVPQKINYQGVVRSSQGLPVANKPIGIKFRILQGSSGGTALSTETQTVLTNNLGLFSTQIGTGIGSSLSSITWSNNSYFLEVWVDTTGGSSFVKIGDQELVSVPYALAAGSAPSPGLNYANDVLTVGNNTVNLPFAANSASTSIVVSGALTGTLSGNVYQLNTPSVTLTGGTTIFGQPFPAGIAQVFGTFPNYSIAVTPTITYDNSTGLLHLDSYSLTSPAYSYTANITPLIGLTGNVLSVGPPSNSVSLPTTVTTPVTTLNIGSGGIGSISNPSTNNFSITIPPTNISGNGVTGTFPNYTVVSTPTTNISGSGVSGSFPNYTITGGTAAQTSITASGSGNPVVSSIGTNSFNIAVPAVSLTTSGALTSGGSYPNLTLNSPSVTVVDNPAVGFAHVSGSFPNYMVTVAPSFNYNPLTGSLVVANTFSPALSYSFNVTPQLSYNSGTLSSGPGTNTVFIPQAAPPVITGNGAAVVNTSANNFTVSVPVTSITPSGGASVSGAYPSFTMSAPQQLNLAASGGAGVSGTYPNITVNAPSQVNLTGTGGAVVSGTYPNVNVNAPQQINLAATGGAGVSGTYPNMTVSAPAQVNLTGTGGAVVSGTYPNVNVNAPQQLNLAASGGAGVSGTYPNMTVSAPAQVNLTGTGGAVISGTYPNVNVNTPAQFNLATSGGASQSGTYPNITVSAPAQLNLTTSGATTLGGTYPNLNVGTPNVTLIGGTTIGVVPVSPGLLQIMGAYPNYSLLVSPNIAYSQTTGSLVLSSFFGTTPAYSYSYQITPALTTTNNIIQSGPPTNTIAISSPATQALTGISATGIAITSLGTQLSGPFSFSKVSATTEVDLYLHCLASTGAIVLGSSVTYELRIDGNTTAISSVHTLSNSGNTSYITLRAVFAGLTVGSHNVSVWAKTDSGTATLVSLDPSATGKIILKETY